METPPTEISANDSIRDGIPSEVEIRSDKRSREQSIDRLHKNDVFPITKNGESTHVISLTERSEETNECSSTGKVSIIKEQSTGNNKENFSLETRSNDSTSYISRNEASDRLTPEIFLSSRSNCRSAEEHSTRSSISFHSIAEKSESSAEAEDHLILTPTENNFPTSEVPMASSPVPTSNASPSPPRVESNVRHAGETGSNLSSGARTSTTSSSISSTNKRSDDTNSQRVASHNSFELDAGLNANRDACNNSFVTENLLNQDRLMKTCVPKIENETNRPRSMPDQNLLDSSFHTTTRAQTNHINLETEDRTQISGAHISVSSSKNETAYSHLPRNHNTNGSSFHPTQSPLPAQTQTALEYLNHQLQYMRQNSIPLSTQIPAPHGLPPVVPQLPQYPIPIADPTQAYAMYSRESAYSIGESSVHSTTSHRASSLPSGMSSGRRSIRLRLVEDVSSSSRRLKISPPFSLGFRRKNISKTDGSSREEQQHGSIVVSWYEGTTSLELQNHVSNSISRKLERDVESYRLLDEDVIPHEEVVLTPFIPSGSRFLLKFVLVPPTKTIYRFNSEAPESPSRAPTPLPSTTDIPSLSLGPSASRPSTNPELKIRPNPESNPTMGSIKEVLSPPGPRQNVIIKPASRSHEKRHVIFVLANYFVLFLSIIAISAEIHERSPRWMEWLEKNIDKVNSCAVDQDSLFKCVSDGDFSGLVASMFLWVTSKTTRRFFLFGFDSVHKLWTVVYESLVTACCWGTSYLFIRRGLNPDTRANFLEKYWKDCAYGSLAGFNASFMKAVLKNLIPREVIEDMLEDNRRLRIVDWIVKNLNH